MTVQQEGQELYNRGKDMIAALMGDIKSAVADPLGTDIEKLRQPTSTILDLIARYKLLSAEEQKEIKGILPTQEGGGGPARPSFR